MTDIKLDRGQIWQDKTNGYIIVGIIVGRNHDVNSGCLWEIVDFVFDGEKCVGSSLRELMEHEIKRRDYKSTVNPNTSEAKIIAFPNRS
jgi:hypothetical protein